MFSQVIMSMKLTQPFSFACISEVDSLKKTLQFDFAELKRLAIRVRPCECSFFQSLGKNAQPGSIPLQYFQAISSTIAENEERASETVELELFFDNCCQAVVGLSHIRHTTG